MKSKPKQTNHNRTIVVIDDDRLFCDSVRHALKPSDMTVLTAHSGNDGLAIVKNASTDVVLLDQKLPDGDGIDFCTPILAANENTKIIFITAYPSFENAVQAIKVGAYDYLSKPFELGELDLAVRQALRTLDLEHTEQLQHFHRKQESDRTILIGADQGLSDVEQLIQLAANNQAPVLITGETGTGKTLVAKAIHFRSQASDSAFIRVNCAAIAENLMEAELFGHEKGAFTGAVAAGKGLFEMADGGTLFLDEIGELPFHLQSKLLGVLDDQQIRRVGGQTFKPVNVRIIAATNADLADAVQAKRFREDLFYRLSVLHIHVPPLRERQKDIAPLADYFVSQIAQDQNIVVSPEQMTAMQMYSWPGNVRELRNIIERAILVRNGSQITPALLLSQNPHHSSPPAAPSRVTAVATLADVERTQILRALEHFQGNHTHAAKALGISRSTLVRKIKVHGIDPK